MICPKCGRSAAAHSTVCDACGTVLTAPQATGLDFDHLAITVTPPIDAGAVTSIPAAEPKTPRPRRSPDAGTGPLLPGESFGPRYHIIRLLGMGGMGAVYQAWDNELGVAVAIKVVLSDPEDPGAAAELERRFKRELLLARQVTHKNVVRIHDLGEIDGIKYITMSYIGGEDLATVMKREGRLSIERTLQIARPVVSGLVAAHTAGIVHRDLKPPNIMIDGDEAVIMDFGIARSTSTPMVDARNIPTAPAGARQSHLHLNRTMVGAVIGTVEYMAPEQGKGQPVDQRADVYAFGLMVYDMLIGRHRAATATNALAELQGRMVEPPKAVRALAPEVPEALERLIMRCLDPDPAKRYQTSAELGADLDRLDDKGDLIPIKRVVGMKLLAAVVIVAAALLAGGFWYTRTLIPPAQHEPVSVIIADFQNGTNEATFVGALEQTSRRALEGASFISAFDRSRIFSTFGERPPDQFDQVAARELAVKQGLGVVLSGTIERRGNGYEVSVKAAQAVTGQDITSSTGRASNREGVLEVVTSLVASVRRALGDETSQTDQLLAMRSISTASLDVVGHYAAAMESQSRGRYEDARQSFLKALELDPKFGLGYQALAAISRNLGQLQDADKYIKEALQYLDGMTERERFATRGYYYRLTGDYQQCANEYGELTARYAGDAIGFNQRALCSSKLRHLTQAVDEMRQSLRILPNHVVFRGNLAVYLDYAGGFQEAEKEGGTIQPPTDLATLAVAFAQLGQGRLDDAASTYARLVKISPRGASWSASGLGQLALYQGRYSDAIRLFEQAAASDLTSKVPYRAARNLTSLAYANLLKGRTAAAVAAAEKALANSSSTEVRFLAGRMLIEAGQLDAARKLAAGLAAELPAEPQAYGKILEGEIALKDGNAREAIKILSDANGVLDTWIGQFVLGRANLAAGAFAQADSAFDRCIKRRGEALALLVDEEPTLGYFPPVYYYQGQVREGLKNAGFADSYREYLKIRGSSTEDPLLPDIRKRTQQ